MDTLKNLAEGASALLGAGKKVGSAALTAAAKTTGNLLIGWSEDNTQEETLVQTVSEYRVCIKNLRHVNIIMLGNVGSGKSSFVNTISTVFKGRHAMPSYVGSADKSLTKELRSYTVSLPDGGKTCPFKIWYAMGMEESGGLDLALLPYIFDGNLPSEFDLSQTPGQIKTHRRYRKKPSISDRMHCVCYVVDGTKAHAMSSKAKEQFKEMRKCAYRIGTGIPIVVLMTKIDMVSKLVKDDVRKAYSSKAVQKVVEKVAACFCIPKTMIYVIKNYHECDINPDIDVLALTALKTLLDACADHLCNVKEKENKSRVCSIL